MDTTRPTQSNAKLMTAIVVIVIVLALLFAYANKKQARELERQQAQEATLILEDTQVKEIQKQESSDEVAAIEADLNNTNVDGLDQ